MAAVTAETITMYCAIRPTMPTPAVRPTPERQREHADRRGEQHPAHDDDHRVGDGAEEADHRRALRCRQLRRGKAEEQREHHERQDRAFGGGGDRIARRKRREPFADGRRRGAACTGSPPAPAMKLAAAAGSTGQSDSTSGKATQAKTVADTSSTPNTKIERAASRPVEAASATDATPVTSSENTSGITVIRSRLSHSVADIFDLGREPISAALPDAADQRARPRRPQPARAP